MKIATWQNVHYVFLDSFGLIDQFDTEAEAKRFIDSGEAEKLAERLRPFVGRLTVGFFDDETIMLLFVGCEGGVELPAGVKGLSEAIISGVFDEAESECREQ